MSKTQRTINFESRQLLLSKSDTADLLGCSEEEIDQLDSSRKLVFVDHFGRRVTTARTVDSYVEGLMKQACQSIS